MTRQTSKSHRHQSVLPQEGTNLRATYDLLYKYRGQRVPFEEWRVIKNRNENLNNLVSFYGLDVLAPKHFQYGPMLLGEWVGKVYIDYTPAADC